MSATENRPAAPAFDTREHLAHAALQAKQRRYDRFTIVDADAHHYETRSWEEISRFIDDPIVKHLSESTLERGSGFNPLFPSHTSDQSNSGRLVRYQVGKYEKGEPGRSRDVVVVERAAQQMGISYTCLFPTPMLNLGLHPRGDVEVALAFAYARWMTEHVVPSSSSIKAMLYLPFNDVDASMRMIEQFGDRPGVVAFMVTSVRRQPVYDNRYMRIYGALEERGLPIAFHSAIWGTNETFVTVNKFASVHALGFSINNMVHLTNWVMNGIQERFPRLKTIWIESGVAWIPFLAQRLDNEFMMRSSEAPLLKRKPSEYMRDFYYTTQPFDLDLGREDLMEATFRYLNAETQLMYASDYPHWDFNLPSVIYDLPFLGEEAKRRILGRNACEVFGLPWEEREAKPEREAAGS